MPSDATQPAADQPAGDHPPQVRQVVDAAAERGVTVEVVRFPEGTATAQDAAAAIGCEVDAICKSLVLIADDETVIVLASGANTVDLGKVAAELGCDEQLVRLATADEARAATGLPIGGTAPYGHVEPVRLLLDDDLLAHEEIWAAAGLPDAVFPIAPDQLLETCGAEVADVAQRP